MKAGLIGWSAHTGLGSMNRDIAGADWIDKWLVPKHPRLGADSLPPPIGHKQYICKLPIDDSHFNLLIEGIDALIFVEIPYIGLHQLQAARNRDITIVCIPMMDQLKWRDNWIGQVDIMYAPTQIARRQLAVIPPAREKAGEPCHFKIAGGSWGIDVDKFKFRERQTCETFLFCNGFGGVLGRKGLEYVLGVAKHRPRLRFIIRSQRKMQQRGMPSNVQLISKDESERVDLYDQGDVLIAPSKFEGLGLQMLEAKASGMPVIVTNAAPMNECWPYRTISCTANGHQGCSSICHLSYENFGNVLDSVVGLDISAASRECRVVMETHRRVCKALGSLRDAITQFRKQSPVPVS